MQARAQIRQTGILALAASASLFAASYDWRLRTGFLRPAIPVDNPMTAAKVELGRYLFYDKRMSVNGRQSCATCHQQQHAFTDGRATAKGTTGQIHPRGSMSLVNVAYAPLLTWANPKLDSLEEQALVPMLGTNPIELGLKGREGRFLAEVRQDVAYRRLFPAAFPEENNLYTIKNVAKAIAAFERSIISTASPYDRYRYGHEENAISDSAKRGEILFFSSERAGCFQCHGGWNFSGPVRFEGDDAPQVDFHNTGLYNPYRGRNSGLHQHTGKWKDIGKFRAPTLRNIALTAPYMHDGSIPTLEEVIDHYAAGGRAQGSPNKSTVLRGFRLSGSEKRDLIEFLKSLTDTELLTDPRWSDPWRPAASHDRH